ncbi:MAG: hypothetical protein VX509_02260, partial [Verrucomicrobiota bacterium]|nr:hypothetical protein [Verrucomicrobiota bacterium]
VWLVLLAILGGAVWFFYTKPRDEQLNQATGSSSQYTHEVTIAADLFSGYAVLRSADTYSPSPAPSSHGGGRPGATGGSDHYENLLVLFCGALCVLGIPALVIYAIAKAKKK